MSEAIGLQWRKQKGDAVTLVHVAASDWPSLPSSPLPCPAATAVIVGPMLYASCLHTGTVVQAPQQKTIRNLLLGFCQLSQVRIPLHIVSHCTCLAFYLNKDDWSFGFDRSMQKINGRTRNFVTFGKYCKCRNNGGKVMSYWSRVGSGSWRIGSICFLA